MMIMTVHVRAIKKGLASCLTKKGSSPRHAGRTIFRFRRQEKGFVQKLENLQDSREYLAGSVQNLSLKPS
jgi:hypothetical protein